MLGTCYQCGKMAELNKYWTCASPKCQAKLKEDLKYERKATKIAIYSRKVHPHGARIFENSFTGLFDIRKLR